MARSAGTIIENNLTRGLITEFTALNFPENAVTDTENCIFHNSGMVTRRKGIDFENNHNFQTITRDNSVIAEYVWNAAGGSGTHQFIVVQNNETLRFYQVTASGEYSSQQKSFTVNLTNFSPAGAPSPGRNHCQFTSGKGFLFVTHPNLKPFYVEYNSGPDTIVSTEIDIKIRDTQGIEDGLADDDGPATAANLSNANHLHIYNLLNQGWHSQAVVADNPVVIEAALKEYHEETGTLPSNSDIFFLMKRPNTEGQEVFNGASDRYQEYRGNTRAPRGHYILSAFNLDRDSVSQTTLQGQGWGSTWTNFTINIPTVTSSYYRPTACAFFAGRIWYSGVNYKGFNTKIYFSQTIENETQIEKCYQQQDPTAEHAADILATDGGVIDIAEVGNVIKLFPFQNSLLVFASNGIWSITGGEGAFKATDYSVSKVSSIGCESSLSFVAVEGLPIWWTLNGIYGMENDPVSGIKVISLTENTIQTLFNTIPGTAIAGAKGAYNPKTKVVQWIYKKSSGGGRVGQHNYGQILNYNLTTKAFYLWSFSDTDGVTAPTINGILGVTNSFTTGTDTTDFIYICSEFTSGTSWKMTFARISDSKYVDWDKPTPSGIAYESHFTTGYKIPSELNKDFQNNYITVYMVNEEDASVFMRGQWDFAISPNSDRYSDTQQCYLPTDNHSVVSRRLKVRGRGKALQLTFISQAGRPFSILGWSLAITSNTQV